MLFSNWLSTLKHSVLRRNRRQTQSSRHGQYAQAGTDRKLPARTTESLESRTLLTTLTVNSALDNVTGGDGQVTLREAIIAANGDTATDLGETGSGADEIVFDPALVASGDASIILSLFDTGLDSGEVGPTALSISSEITIEGPSGDNGITIERDDADTNEFRLFSVETTGTLTLENLTLSGGLARGGDGADGLRGGGGGAGLGGAIFNQGDLTIVSSTLSGNMAQGGDGGDGGVGTSFGGGGGMGADAVGTTGGGPNGGTPGNSGGFGGGGGGDNGAAAGGFGGGGGASAGFGGFGGGGAGGGGRGGFGGGGSGAGDGGSGGGGIGGAVFNNEGTVTITNSTFSGNSAQGGTGSVGGVNGGAAGSALFNRNGTTTITNSTFASNVFVGAGNGMIRSLGDGMFRSANLVLHNVIAADTTGGGGLDLIVGVNDGGIAMSSGVGNLIEGQAGFNGTIVTSADPGLDALADNGGPTLTHAITAGSSAEDAGDNTAAAGLTADQRGAEPRIVNSTVDIGAFEIGAVQPAAPVLPAISTVIQFSTDGGATFSDDLTVVQGDEVIVRINYDNTGEAEATNAQAGITLPSGVSLVEDSTRTALTPTASETVTNTDSGQSGTIDESAVWSGTTLTISPQAGLYAQSSDATSGTLEIGKKGFLNLHDAHYFNGAERYYVTADPDIVGTNVSNTQDGSATAVGVDGAYGLAGVELRTVSLLGQRYLNYQEGHYNFFTDHIYRDTDGTNTRTSNTLDTAGSFAGTAGAHILHPDSNFANLDLLGNRYINLHEGRYQNGGDTISVNLTAGGTNTSDTPDAAPSFAGTLGAYTLIDSDLIALDTLDTARGAGFVEFRVDTSSATGDVDFTALISDLSGSSEFDTQSDTGTLTVNPGTDAFVVTTAVDENDGSADPGTGAGTSLREAIIAANADPNQSTITFDASLDGTPILLTITGSGEDASATGDLDITTEVTVTGNGADNTIIDAGGATGLNDRVFHLQGDGPITLDGLTVRGGTGPNYAAGGIEVSDVSATVTGSVVENNTGNGITSRDFTDNTLLISETRISGNSQGGLTRQAVGATSTTNIVNSTISGNQQLGGIANFAAGNGTSTMHIIGSTISGNSKSFAQGGAGILNQAAQGGTVELTLTNSTISGNTTTGGVGGAAIQSEAVYSYNPYAMIGESGLHADLTITNSTIAGNTGGVASIESSADSGFGQTSNVEINNTIVTGATDDTATSGDANTVNGNNNLSDGTVPGTIAAVSNFDANLADNGGPTLTHALFDGSPAVDAGDNALAVDADDNPLTTDQRGAGFDRILDGTVDIGAVEGSIPVPPPTNIVVTTAVDENDGTFDSGTGAGTSLREAIIAANSDPDANTITFDASLDGTPILLTIAGIDEEASATGDLDVTTEIVIQGNGALNTIIDAGGSSGLRDRVLDVLGGDLSLDAVTITGGFVSAEVDDGDGDDAGGIDVDRTSTLTVTNSTISGNTTEEGVGGGFNSRGSVTLTNSVLSENSSIAGGGGFGHSASSLTITDSTISGNSGYFGGGGIYHDGDPWTVSGSTISGNTTNFSGGGLYNYETELTIINSTISGNSAGDNGGGIYNYDTLTVINSTITGNVADSDGDGSGTGGGIDSDTGTSTTLHNTIVAGNEKGSVDSRTPDDIGGEDLQSVSSNNLFGDANTSGGLIDGGINSIFGNDGMGTIDISTVLDTTLADNGGPTQTHALVAGSPAIDAGDNAQAVDTESNPLATDQRGTGFDRIESGTVDIGAFEVTPPDSFVVTTEVDENDGTADPGTGAGTSLREAIIAANANVNPTTITFDPSLNGTPILLTISGINEEEAATGDLDVTTEVTIQGNGEALTIIDAGGAAGLGDRVFEVQQGASLTIENITVQGGSSLESSSDKGGALFIEEDASLILQNATLSGNTSGNDGGAFYADNRATVTITDSTISGNSTGDEGGGIYTDSDVMLTITGSTITGNVAENDGGGIHLRFGTATITDSTISGNTSGEDGGGIADSNDRLTVVNSNITGNMASEEGGGIYSEGELTVADSTISGNAGRAGGGVYIGYGDSASISGSTISGNMATENGGGVFNYLYGAVSITNSTISGNSATRGGGIYDQHGMGYSDGAYDHDVTLTNSTITNNTVTDTGGGIYVDPTERTSPITLNNTIVAGNSVNDLDGATFAGSNNVIQDGSDAGTSLTNTINQDPLLGPLADNGGPTQTHALLAGSAAINAGDNALAVDSDDDPLLTDQRGTDFSRVFGSTVDIGAFEFRDRDFGDAPATFGTLNADDGAQHLLTGPQLGALRDVEVDGQPTDAADGDDSNADADEDGVTALSPLVVSAANSITASFSIDLQNADLTSNFVDAWIDFDGSGTFEAGEQVLDNENLGTTSGAHIVSVSIPFGTTAGDKVARFRLSSTGDLDPTGLADDGEVEDYVFSFTDASAGGTINLLENGGDATIRVEEGDLIVSQGGNVLFRVPANEVGDLNIVGSDGDDVINLSGPTAPFSSNLSIDGGDGTDEINFQPGPINLGDGDLSIIGEETNLGTDITTTGDISFAGPVLLTADVSVNGGNVTFQDSVDSGALFVELIFTSRDTSSPSGLAIFNTDSSANGEETLESSFIGEFTGLVTQAGSLFIADVSNSEIIEFPGMGDPLSRVDVSSTGSGDPIDLVITPTGEFLVSVEDGETSRVERFGSDGTHIDTFTNGGGRGIALSPAGLVYVSLPDDESVGVYGLDGTLTANLVTGEEFNPSDIAIDEAGNIYVSDPSSGDIFQFDSTGAFQGSFVSGLEGPLGIAFDSLGNLYVTDPEGGRINVFGPDGSPQGTIASGLDAPQFLATTVLDLPPQEFSLTVNSSGTTEFGGLIGSNGPLANLTTDGGGSTVLGNEITVNGTATFNDAVALIGDTQINGDADFNSTVDSDPEAGSASLDIDGNASFGGPVGSNDPLESLAVTGTTTINGGTITTNDGLSFVGDVILQSDTTLTTSAVNFGAAVDSESGENNSLTVNADAAFRGDIGQNDPLGNLSVSQNTTISTSAIETTGTQTFTGPVKLETTSELTASQVIFESTVDGDSEFGDFSLTVNGDADFNGSVGDNDPLVDLTVNGSTNVDARITTNGTQTFNGPLTVDGTFDPNGSDATQPVVDGDVTFESTGSFTVTIDGNMPGDDQDQIQVNGTSRTVNIDGNLTIELGEDFATGSQHVIIDNTDPGSSVSGNFVGLPEGTAFDVDGTTFVITYMGGDGNDVVLLTDVTPPTADIVDVAPDPRVEDAGIITINFDEPVTGVTIDDFTLTRDETPVPLDGLSVNGDGATYTLDLSSVTGEQGTYVLTLDAEGSGIVDIAGNDLEENASDTWIFAASGAEDDGEGNVTVDDDGGVSNEDLTISSVGGNTQLSDANNAIGAGDGTTQVDPQTVEFDTPPNNVVINGGAGDDTLTIDLRGGNPLPGGTLTFNGGEAGNDTLVIIDDNGTTVISGTYTPDIVNGGDGVHTLDLAGGGTLTINFTGLEPTVISGIPNYTFLSPGSEDVITVGAIVEAGADALTVAGTSDGITFETLVLFDVDNFTIDLGTNDSIGGGSGNDTLTIAGGLNDGTDIARGLQNLTIDLGTGGSADVDSLTINSDVDVPGTVSIDGTVINSGVSIGQDVTIGADADLSPGPGTAQLSTGNLTFEAGATLSIDIADGTPGTGLDQLLVTGTVDVTGANLNIDASSSTVGGGTSLVIIDNDGSDAVTGTFAGLDEGATVQINGEAFQISYVGGDGNDVALTNLPIVSISGPEGPVNEGDSATFTVTLNEESTDPVSVVLSINDGTATVASGDYSAIAASGVAPTVTFAPGETSKTVMIPVNADGTTEADEDFSVSLVSGINAVLDQNGNNSATATIDGAELQITSIPDQSVAGGAGLVTLTVASSSSDDNAPVLTTSSLPAFVTFVDRGDGTGIFSVDAAVEDVDSLSTISVTATDSNGSVDTTFDVTVVAPSAPIDTSESLIRINSIGGAVGNFDADQFANTGRPFGTGAAIDVSDSSIPEGTPAAIFQTARWDAAGGPELSYNIPIAAGDYQVNLYFAEIWGPAASVGARVFDVSIEGELVLDNFDVFAAAGAANKGIVRSFDVTSDGTIDIDFGRVVQNPNVMAIEITERQTVINTAPMLSTIDAQTVVSGESLSIPITAIDADSDDVVTLTASGLPDFAAFTDNGDGTGSVTLDPTASDVGAYPIAIQATSGIEPLTDVEAFVATVTRTEEVEEPGHPAFGGSVINGGVATATAGVRIDGPTEPVDEGTAAVFTVSLDSPATESVVVLLELNDGTATVGDGDFLPLTNGDVNPAVVFAPGEQSKLVSIEITADGVTEPDEIFSVSLESANGAMIEEGNDSATATIKGASLAISPVGDQTIAGGAGTVDLKVATVSSDGLPAMLFAPDPPSFVSFTDNGDGTGTFVLDASVEDVGAEATITVTATDSNGSVDTTFDVTVVAPSAPIDTSESLIRINSIGGAVGNFDADQFANTGRPFGTGAAIDISDSSIPEGTPAEIFQTARWDAAGGPELSYNIPIAAGDYQVNLYFAEIWGPAASVGARVFDVSIEGELVLDNFDVFAAAGAVNKGIVRSFDVTSDGTIDIDFGRVVQNPNVMAIEITERQTVVNTAPVISPVADQNVDEGATLNIPVSAFDNDGDDIMLSILGLPAFASFTDDGDGTGSIEVNPQDGDDGDFVVSVNAESGEQGLTDSTALRISVADTLDGREQF